MKPPFFKPRFSAELKRLAKNNIAQGKALSILDDVVFKAMLTSDTEDSREALRSLLSACTRREISAVQVVNNELIPAHLAAKSPRLDAPVTFNDGEAANLEMQLSISSDDLKARAVYYAAMLLAGQSRKGKPYKQIKRVYQIFFLNFKLFPKSTKIPRRYYYIEETEHDRLSDVTEIIFYEMPKLEQRVQEYLEGKIDFKTLSNDEMWCIYFRYRHEDWAASLIKELCRKEDGIMRAEKTINKVSREYKRFARNMAIMKNSMDRASDIYNARMEGIAETNLEIARKMKKAGKPINEIMEFTGLPPETIERL